MTIEPATIGHNGAPDPIDEALAPFGDYITEADNWLDGEPITNDEQLKATDDLLKHIKAAIKAVNGARDENTKPLHEAWKTEVARWKPTQDDLARYSKGLVEIQGPYKKALAAKKEAERRAAWEAAEAKRKEAEEAARQAQAGDIEAQRQADEMAQAAMDAKKAASSKQKDTVKGMRTVHKYEIEDGRAAINWIAKNDREAMAEFLEGYVRKNHKDKAIDGVKSWQEKEAY